MYMGGVSNLAALLCFAIYLVSPLVGLTVQM